MLKVPTLTRYTYIFATLNAILLLTAVLTIIVVITWAALFDKPLSNNSDLYIQLAIPQSLVIAGYIGVGLVVITVLVSLWTLLSQPTKEDSKTKPLSIYLIFLLILFVFTLTIASATWFITLEERARFTPVWNSLPRQQKIFIQDDLQCCGWFNATTEGLFNSSLRTGYCSNPDRLPVDPDPNVLSGCIDKFDKMADDLLNNTFTIGYGFTALQFFLILVSGAIANLRIQEKRFLKIDYKQRQNGKGGFV
ncbi:hypothetical protein O181_052771 [Austropuccinia psidii MF-1]|uniref:Tetraspanin n=1 Tax=Austropuccinia psidii MF-1 TaxID=1389203 RepID=A0A9Q3HPJ8_9BASI|nr:hypothetical protein [Austropuccinia psidii MF-1]